MEADPPSSTLTLSDGRELGYIDCTVDAPTPAPVILYFHGFPGSRLEGAIAAPHTRRLGVRLIATDRPGMGLSTFQQSRTLADWPKDVLELVDHLKINTFYILGDSGGSPYVIACAHLLPHERVLGAAIVSGLYPLSLGVEGMPMPTRALLWAAGSTWLSGWVAPFLDWLIGKTARDYAHPEKFEEQFMKDMSSKPGKDLTCLDDLVLRKQVIEAGRESFKQGANGVAWDGRLYAAHWGFTLADVEFEGMYVWHGRLDANVPVAMAEKAARLLKGARLRVIEDEAHLSLPANYMDEIIETLVGRQEKGVGTDE